MKTNATYSTLSTGQCEKLNIGCGPNVLSGWVNCDLEPLSKEVLFVDAREPLPFGDSRFAYIFNEHFIEHISFVDGLRFLRQCRRVLCPGGKIRISTPNLDFLMELHRPEKSYLQKRYIQWAMKECIPYHQLIDEEVLPEMDAFVINNFFRDWGHQFIYDLKTLSYALSICGFSKINPCSPGQSDDPVLRDLERHGQWMPEEFNRMETICVEAERAD